MFLRHFLGPNPGQTGPIVVYIIRWYVNISRSCDNPFIHMCFVHYLFSTDCNTRAYWQIGHSDSRSVD